MFFTLSIRVSNLDGITTSGNCTMKHVHTTIKINCHRVIGYCNKTKLKRITDMRSKENTPETRDAVRFETQ